MMVNGVLRLEHVSKEFTHKGVTTRILQDLTLDFLQGTSYAIMGVSGTGKSTLMHLLSGIEDPSQGSVLLNQKPLSRISQVARSSLVAKQIGVAFQNPYLIAELNVLENISLPGLLMGDSLTVATKRAQQLLSYVQLEHKETSNVLTLSGGQQQRVSLARALYHTPPFLIADEPTGSLDEQTADIISDLLVSFCTDFGIGVIISTHDKQVACKMNTVYTLHNGNLSLVAC